MANDERDMYKKYVEELPALNLNIEEHNKITDLIKNKKKAKKESNIKYYIKIVPKKLL